ncbi:hypothetical protein WJX84_005202, partial [Apatococcus fuscideae]
RSCPLWPITPSGHASSHARMWACMHS